MKKVIKKNQLMITALAFMIAVAGYLHFSGNVTDQIMIQKQQADSQSEEQVEAANMLKYEVEDTYTAQELAALDEEQLGQMEDYDSLDIVSLDEDMSYYEAQTSDEEGYEDELAAVDSSDVSIQMADSSDIEEGEIPGETVFTSGMSVNTLEGAKLLKEQTRAANKATLLEIINNENISKEQKQAALDSMLQMTTVLEKEMAAEILLSTKGFQDAVVSMSGDTADVVVYAEQLSETQRAQIEDIVTRKTGVSIENIVITTSVNE